MSCNQSDSRNSRTQWSRSTRSEVWTSQRIASGWETMERDGGGDARGTPYHRCASVAVEAARMLTSRRADVCNKDQWVGPNQSRARVRVDHRAPRKGTNHHGSSGQAEAFEQLVLPQKHRIVRKTVVESHNTDEARKFDDFVAGKGHGLVINLFGNPGTGKSLTAEAMSECTYFPSSLAKIRD